MLSRLVIGCAIAIAAVGCRQIFGLEDPVVVSGDTGGADGPGDGSDAPDGGAIKRKCTLAMASDHTCVLRTDTGVVSCYGSDGMGQLGNGPANGGSLTPAIVATSGAVASISGHGFHTCVALSAGGVQCWGFNDRAQIGDGSMTTQQSPTNVVNVATVAELDSGRTFNCVRRTDDAIACWGENVSGQHGDGTMTNHPTVQTTVMGLMSTPLEISTGGSHACARLANGSLWCWGEGANGRLGDGSALDRYLPVQAVASGVSHVIAASYQVPPDSGGQTCALHSSGTVTCFGSNQFGQLGIGSTSPSGTGDVMNLNDAVEIAGGRYHFCALRMGGRVVCWGRNEYGQLGDNTTSNQNVPVAVALPGMATYIAAGGWGSCALLVDNTLYCWGADGSGQLGTGTTAAMRPSPAKVSHTLCE